LDAAVARGTHGAMQRSSGSGSWLCALGLAVALLGACGGARRAPASPAPPAYRGQTPVLLTARAVSMLPADTWFVLAAASPRGLATALRWPESLRAHGTLRDELAAATRAIAGADVLDPDNLDEIGLDAASPFGLAIFAGERDAAGALFAGVSDRGRLQAFLERALAPELGALAPRAMGEATVLVPAKAGGVAFVLRGGLVFVLAVEDAADRERLVAALATGARARSLAADPELVAAMKRLDFGAEAAGYLAMHRLAERLIGEIDRNDARVQGFFRQSLEATEAEIASAEAGGADAATVGELRERLAQQKEWMAQAGRSSAGTRKLLDELLPMGGIALGLGIDGAALRVSVSLRPRTGSLAARFLRHGDRPLAILRAIDDVPVFALGAHAEPGALPELVSLMLEGSGDSLEGTRVALRTFLGVDLDKDILPLLDGEMAVAVTGDRERLPASGAAEDAMGLTMVAGLRDAARARALLDRVSKNPALAAAGVERPAGRGLVAPAWGQRRLHIDVAGAYLVVSTDPGAAQRVAAGGAGAFAGASGGAHRRAQGAGLTGEGRALLGAWAWDGLFLLDPGAMLGLMWGGTPAAPPPPPVADQGDGAQPEPNAALQRELAAIDAELAPLQAEIERAMQQRILATTRPLGTTLLVVHAGAERGLAGFGGQFTSAPHVSDAVLGWVLGWLELSGAGDLAPDPALAAKKERLGKLHERRWQIIQQLESQPQPAPESGK
jgi:hypothetical protein